MPRYIDADYLLKEIAFYADRPTKSAMKMIEEIALHPANIVERTKGTWIREGFTLHRCSKCEFKTVNAGWVDELHEYHIRYNFCPICGEPKAV